MKKRKKYNPFKSAQKAIRDAFFENGGTTKQWLPPKQVILSKKDKNRKHKSQTEE